MSHVVMMVSGSCCMPWLSSYEEVLEMNIKKMIDESSHSISYVKIPVTRAMYSGVPKEIYTELMQIHQKNGTLPLPAVIVDKTLIGYTTIDLNDLAKAFDKLKGDSYENN